MKITFKRNMSTLDRVIRTLIGSTLIIVGPVTGMLTADTLSVVLLGGLGALAIMSAIFSYCFLYEVSGISTN